MRHLEIFEDDSILEYEEIQLLNMGRNMLIVYHHHHHQLTLRMVPKKSSTNFWTVPFVDSNRVRKISGMDLGEDVKTIILLIIIIVIFVIVIIIIIVIKNVVLTCASEALRLRLSFEDDPASPSGTFERHHPDHYHDGDDDGDDGDEDDEDYGDGDNNDDDDGNDDDITRPGKRARAGPAPLGC